MFITEFPELCKEWDYDKNAIDPHMIKAQSHKKAWWKCSNGHSYLTIIGNRTNINKSGCPYCCGQKVLKGYNDLLSKFPELCKEWDYDKNIINPDEITSKSGKKIWWKCSKNHSWQAIISSRINKNNNCPYCNNKKVLKGYNDLLSKFPEICKEWDYDKNILKPDEVTSKSGKKVWWKCSKGHTWQAYIYTRTDNGVGCPYCSGQKVLKGYNDLASKFPELVKEWDYDKNILKPDEVTSKSGKKVWWKCFKGHTWQAIIKNRTNQGTNCPICIAYMKTSFGEQSIYYYLKGYNALNRYKYWGKEIDIYLPDKHIGIEFNGLYWHKNRTDKDKEKELFLTDNGIKMFYIYESDKNKIQDNRIYFDYKYQYNNNLEWAIKELFKLLNVTINVNIKQDKEKIYKQYKY